MLRTIAFILFLIGLSNFADAAEPAGGDTLPPVVVTATRIETPEPEVTTSISVITADDLRSQQAETVLEALRDVPGLDVVQSGSRGTNASVFIRGAESDQVLVLIDGAEVNLTTTGGFNFAHLTTEDIDRIEILRGAGGTLYGSQAIGGVIHIITKAGRGKPELSLAAEGGNGGTHRQGLALRGGTNRLGYAFSASRLETDGFRPVNDDYQNLATSTRLDFRFTENTRLRGIFRFRKTDLGLFNSNNFLAIDDPNARENTTSYLVKGDWEQKLLPGWDYRISTAFFKEHDKFTDDPDPGSFDVPTRNRFRPRILATELQSNYRWRDWSTTTFGMEYKKRQATTTTLTATRIREDQRNMAYYVQEQLQFFSDRLILVSGVRLDDHQAFGTEWSPAASAAYLFPRSGTKLKLGYAQGFKAPSLNELFDPFFGNPRLGPEQSWEINAGIEQELFNKHLMGLTYFHREVDDLIQAVEIAPFTFVSRNVARVRVDGLELFGNLDLGKGFSARANYTFLENDTSSGRVVRRPRHRGNLLFDYRQDRFQINLNINMVGKRDDFDVDATAAPFLKIQPGYVKVDLASSYALPWKPVGVKSLSLHGKIENLFDKKYEEADGFPARPLNFLVGIRGTFGKD